MTKKIFAIIGIVCGSVAVFCGAVFGVMALMGKFKTPVIYPTTLNFEQTEITVIQGAVYDTEKELSAQEDKPTIHEFKLVGLNPDFDRPVNQTECYVWFKNSEGPKLITLCDVNGNPLQANGNRFLVHCNQPIYFMVNKIADDGIIDPVTNKVTDGVAILEARSVNDTLKKPDSPLNIYIDRKVKAVYVLDKNDYNDSNMGNSTFNTQDITIGTNMDLNFEYKVITELSHRPIQAVNAKEIELYLDATGIQADYIPVTQQEIANPNSPLYGLIRYENNKFVLNSAQSGVYNFVVAVFPTYEAKTQYEASIADVQLQYPNVHRASAMLQTKLSVEVQDISISSLTFKRNSEAWIHLYLYAQDDYISLDGAEDLIANAKNNSLGAQLWVEDGWIEDTTRLDSFAFADFTNDNMWYGENYSISFADANRDNEYYGSSVSCVITNNSLELINKDDNNLKKSFTIKKSNLRLDDKLTVINHLEEADGTRYYSTRSWAVLDETNEESPKIRLLRPGNYLNFYIKTKEGESNNFIIATSEQFNYEATSVAGFYGKNKSWQIIAKEEPNLEEGESLVVGAFVVNGAFTNSTADNVNKYFGHVGIKVDRQDLEYEVKSITNTLDVSFKATQYTDKGDIYDDGVIYGEKTFEDIINITGGSYTEGVLVVEKDENNKNIDKIRTLQHKDNEGKEYAVTYQDKQYDEYGNIVSSTTYYLVGYIDDSGKFQNKVKLSGEWKKTDVLNLKMLLLHNAYGETVNHIIENLQTPDSNVDIVIDDAEIVSNLTVELKANYVLNTSLMSVKVWKPAAQNEGDYEEVIKKDGVYQFYEREADNTNADDNIIGVLSSNAEMLSMVKNFYASESDTKSAPIVSFNSGNIAVEIVDNPPSKCGQWCYKITKLIGDGDEFVGTIECGGEFALPTIKVLSGRPGSLVFNTAEEKTEERTQIDLFTSTMKAETANTYLHLEIGYEVGYVYTYSLVVGGVELESELTEASIFNKNISGSKNAGFQSKDDKQQTYAVNYIAHKGVLNFTETGVKAVRVGQEILEVNVAGTPGYIKVVVTSKLKLEPDSKTLYKNTEESTTYLNKLGVQITYVDNQTQNQQVLSSKDNDIIIKDVSSVGYQVYSEEEQNTYIVYQDTNESGQYEQGDEIFLTIANDETNGWTFARRVTYLNLKVKFTVETLLGNISCEVNFSSAVAVGINDAWAERNFYYGTNIVLGGNTNAVFNFKDSTGNEKPFKYSVDGGISIIDIKSDTVFTPATIGDVNIWMYYGDDLIRDDLIFSVLPNIVATPKEVKLASGAELKIKDLFDLKAYKTGVSYGSEEKYLYSNNDNLEDVEDSNLIIKADNAEPTLTWDDTKKSIIIGDMQNMNGTEKDIVLQYRIDENNVVNIITHKYIVEHKFAAEVVNFEDNKDKYYLYKANKEYVPLTIKDKSSDNVVQMYNLISMTHNVQEGDVPLTFVIKDGKFILNANITQNRTINVTFMLQNANDELDKIAYTTDITLIPYTPELNGEVSLAYTGDRYDVLKELYDVSKFNKDIITSLKVNKFFNSLGTNITPQIVDNFVPNGYVAGVSDPQCEVIFNDFVGEELVVNVEFVIQYNDGSTYTYYVPLTIKNRQSLTVQYPEQNLGGDQEISFIFDERYSADAKNLVNNSQKVTVANFEPILVYTNADVSIDFLSKDVAKNVVRAKVSNLNGDADTNLGIEVIAYERSANGAAANKNKIVVNGSMVTISKLGASQADFAAYYILKLSTDSKNFKYYFIRLYCTNLNTMSVSNNIDVVAHQNKAFLQPSKELKSFDVNSTISQVVDELKNEFATVYKKEYNVATTSLWLYNGFETGSVYDNMATPQWSQLSSTATVASLIHDKVKFTTLTIGLMHSSVNAQHIYGTITIYVQPSTDIRVGEGVIGLKFNKPNGEFTMELENTTLSIVSPINGFSFDKNEIYIDGVNRDKIDEKDVNYGLITDGETALNINKRVEKDTTIRVKYVRGETVAYVTYTYKATTLPNAQTTSTEVGIYDKNEGIFNNVVDLKPSGKLATKYFSNYVGKYEIYIGQKCVYISNGNASESVSGVAFDNDKITFTQSAQQWEVDLRFVYSDFGDGTQSRTFRFVIKPSVSVAEVSGITGGDGSSMNAPYATKINSDIYNTDKASFIEIKREMDEASGIAKFTVAGFEIRVNAIENNTTVTNAGTVMDIGFNEPEFVFGDADGKFANIAENTTIYFPHMATNKVITADIKILHRYTEKGIDREITYLTKRIYIEIIKTYGGLCVNYLSADATHENVLAGEYGNLNTKFTTNNGLTLLDINGDVMQSNSYNLVNMGFEAVGNPNKIEFLRGSFMDIVNNVLTFYQVDSNTETKIYLNNNAGIIKNSLEYRFQIMKGDKVDGLDFTINDDVQNTDGRLEDGYMSFMMGDAIIEGETDYGFTKTFKLGKMLDEKNTTAFTLTGLRIYKDKSFVDITYTHRIDFTDGEPYQFNKDTNKLEKNRNGAFEDEKVFSDVFDAIQYRFYYSKDSGYEFYITLHINTNQVYLTVCRSAGEPVASQTIKFSLGGVNGDKTIIKDFTTYLSAEKVTLKSDRPTVVYSYETIDLKDVFNITPVDAAITYEVAKGGTYSLSAQEKPIPAKADNILFSLTNNTILRFKAVGQDTDATLVFNAKCGDYIIETIVYNITVRCNYTVIANGGYWGDYRFNDSLYTDFALTYDKTQDTSPYTNGGITYNFEHSKNESTLKSNGKFVALAYDVYRLNTETSLNQGLVTMSMNNVDGCTLGGTPGEYYLTFTKDYNSTLDGEIILTLTINTDIGDYSMEWRINVTPIVEVRTSHTDNYKHQNGAANFKSNETITLASYTAAVIINPNQNEDEAISISVQYSIAIASGATNVANKDLFELTSEDASCVAEPTDKQAIDYKDKMAKVKLPVVPASLNGGQAYYVTYRVVVTYLGLSEDYKTARVFYVTYLVSNEQKVTIYSNSNEDELIHSADVDVTTSKVTDKKLTIMSWNNAGYETSKELFKTEFTGADESEKKKAFSDFVKTLTGARVIADDGQNKTIVNFDFEYNSENITIGNETQTVYTALYIDLSKGKDEDGNYLTTLFNNELIGEFALMNGETQVVTIAPYSKQNPSGFRLYASDTLITPLSNYKLSDIIKNTSLITIDNSIANNPVGLNTIIVGIGTSPSKAWVNNAEEVQIIDNKSYATIEVQTGTGAVYSYYIKAAVFSGNTGDYYSTQEVFYYISGAGELYIVDYIAQGTAEDYFRVPYPIDASATSVSINIANYVMKWYMNGSVLTNESVRDVTVNGTLPESATLNGSIITISTESLQQYKNDNPEETEFVIDTISLKVTGLNDTLRVIIKFKLPENVSEA